MLPLPGSPGASVSRYRARLAAVFDGADPRVCIAFWLFGLINNVLYVIILSSALDLVGPTIPKGVVLLADVIPSFLCKLTAPYCIHHVPYNIRILGLVAFSSCGMLLIALSPETRETRSIIIKLGGAALASISSGLGELSFLGLTHYYGRFSLAAWGSGTGGAGLIGAGAYVLATTTIGLSVRTSLLTFSFLPVIMLISFFGVLPCGPLRQGGLSVQVDNYGIIQQDDDDDDDDSPEVEDRSSSEHDTLLSTSMQSNGGFSAKPLPSTLATFRVNLRRASKLFFPYMLPLLLVYVAEYTINQGVAPTLLFPLPSTPFSEFRAFYPTYNAIYQIGVFLSRSSTPFFRIHTLYTPSMLQVANLLLLTMHAMFNFIPSVYIIFLIVFWEGLLGGLVYVSTFAEIADHVPKEDREFSLGATTVSDSGGICIAGFIGIALEIGLCRWQVNHGRDFCRKT